MAKFANRELQDVDRIERGVDDARPAPRLVAVDQRDERLETIAVGRTLGRATEGFDGTPFPPRGGRWPHSPSKDGRSSNALWGRMRGIERSEMAPNVRHSAQSLGAPQRCRISRK